MDDAIRGKISLKLEDANERRTIESQEQVWCKFRCPTNSSKPSLGDNQEIGGRFWKKRREKK